jgi:hypothetical protein
MSGKKRNRDRSVEQPQSKKVRTSPDADIWRSVKEDELELDIHETHNTPVKYGLLQVSLKMLLLILLTETKLVPCIAGIIGEYVGDVTYETISKAAYSKIQAHHLDYDYLCAILDGKMHDGQSSYTMIHLAIELASYALKLKELDGKFTTIYKQLESVWKIKIDKKTKTKTGVYSSVTKIADELHELSVEFLLVRGTPDAIPFISTRTRLTGYAVTPTMWDFTICMMQMMTKFGHVIIRNVLLSKLRAFDDFEDERGIVKNAMIKMEHRNTMRNIGAHQSVGRQLAIMVDKTLTYEEKRKLLKIESVKTHQENTALENTLQKDLNEIGYGK